MNGSYPPSPTPYQTPPRPPGRGGSCFLRGCLVLVVIVMLAGVLVGTVGWYLSKNVLPFLTHAPVAIPKFQGGEAAYAAAAQKLAAFNQTVASGQRATVSLTGDDLNALAAHDPQLSKYRDRVYLSILNNQIVVETSFPVADDSSLRPDQRWFANARAVLDASYSSGDFAFLLARFEPLDRHPPSAFLLSLAKYETSTFSQGFNRNFHDHPEQYGDLPQFLAQIHTIILQDNQIVATSVEHPKPAAPPVAPTPETP